MSILLHRNPRDEHLLLGPSTTSAPAERPRGVEPARLGCEPGTSRNVLDVLMAAGLREKIRTAIGIIQDDLGTDPLSADPLPRTDWQDRLLGVEARALANLSRLTASLTHALNVHEHATVKPVIAAQRELLDVADFVVLDAVLIRREFAVLGYATEDAFVTHAAEWILAGAEETGAEAAR